MLGDDADGALPRDRPVVRRADGSVHRLGEPALLAEPVVGSPGQVADRMDAKKSAVTRRSVASSATALAPFSQNSRRVVSCGSGHAHPGQSNPSGWLTRNIVRAALDVVIWSLRARIEAITPGIPAAHRFGGTTLSPSSVTSSRGAALTIDSTYCWGGQTRPWEL